MDRNHVSLTEDQFKKQFADGNYKINLTLSRTKLCNKKERESVSTST